MRLLVVSALTSAPRLSSHSAQASDPARAAQCRCVIFASPTNEARSKSAAHSRTRSRVVQGTGGEHVVVRAPVD